MDDSTEVLEDVPVRDLNRADYVLGKIAAARRVRDEELAHFRSRRDALDLLEHAAKERCQRVLDWYEPQLRSFHTAVLRDDPDRRTITIENGSLRAKRGQPEWDFGDGFIDWCFANGRDDLVRTKSEVRKPEAKKAFVVADDGSVLTSDGEVVPGVKVDPAAIEFSVVTPEAKP